ncbi:DUF418 domain-containing protein [Paenibacillus sp. N1-5-1-14]|uniref:DUF418 domain-containing protein n=1 Tax=Paenibacillus radicibacter TaxID=2972488 RepID=UPI002158AA63|nr:DUF418 domain-containing protein [Paenibacillus radicibacter]MCR8645368.1 DUF418 domain-containing protein [Paenibacillus radicibacter]
MNTLNISYKRIDTMDYLRGFCLLGILLVNSFQVMGYLNNYSGLQHELYNIFNRKFYPILYFLFGLGCYFFMNRSSKQEVNKRYLPYLRRLVFLFVLGLIHTYYAPPGIHDVLMFYAVLGLFIAMFFKVNKWINLIVTILLIILSIITALFQPYYGDKILWLEIVTDICRWVSLMMLGYTMGQFKFFDNIYGKLKYISYFLMAVICTYVILFYVRALIEISNSGVEILTDYLVSSMIVSIIILTLHWDKAKIILSPIKLYGQMSLTNYLAQSALLIVFSSIISVGPIHSLVICIIIHAVLIIFSIVWLRFYNMGPVEMILRYFTYWSMVPIKKKLNNTRAEVSEGFSSN